MDDSDDYFDDFVLDDRTIAALDQVESQYAETQSRNPAFAYEPTHPIVRKDQPPPAKRQKVTHVPSKRVLSEDDDYEDLPEISLHGGNYQVALPPPAPASVITRPHTNTIRTPTSRLAQAKPTSAGLAVRDTAVNVSSRPPPLARQASGPILSASKTHPTLQAPRNIQRRQSSQSVFGSQAAPRLTQKGPEFVSKMEIEILRAQLDELKNGQNELQQKLREAEDARYAKEGEVSILRASINKTSEEHAADVARLQAAREAAEAARLQLIKDQKDELERLKTHYTFRQHELETTTRKPPASVLKKQIRAVPNTPVKMPSQMRDWSTTRNGLGGMSLLAETPRRPRFGVVEKAGSQRPRRLPPLFEEDRERQPALPGFQNAFTSSPARGLSQKPKDKGKGKQRASSANDNMFFAEGARSSPLSSPTVPPFEHTAKELAEDPLSLEPVGNIQASPKSHIPAMDLEPDLDEDVEMLDTTAEESDEPDDVREVAPPNWRDELLHIIFTHTLPPVKSPTMQTLLDTSLTPTASQEQQQSYRSACARFLDGLGTTSRPTDWDDHLRDIARILTSMARILNDTAALSSLSALFNMFRVSSYSIPSFTTALLSLRSDDDVPQILHILCDIICNIMSKSEGNEQCQETQVLSREVLCLLEVIALTVPEEQTTQLSFVMRAPQVISTLLAPTQPIWLLTLASRVLCVLASHESLFRPLLSSSPSGAQTDVTVKHFGRYIDQLSFYLIDPSKDVPEGEQLREHILTFIASLALSHVEVLATLVQSQTLIPCIIIYLTNATNSFWEDSEEVVSSPTETDKVLRITSRTIALLYYMVFTPSEPVRLNQKLHQTPHRLFNGVSHMFVVTMGRFSFADSPSWLGDAARLQLEQTVDMARELLELAMQGPELDMVWSAFQADSDGDLEENDEEREARRLHPTD